jgi:hypothetical protein
MHSVSVKSGYIKDPKGHVIKTLAKELLLNMTLNLHIPMQTSGTN